MMITIKKKILITLTINHRLVVEIKSTYIYIYVYLR